MQKITLITCPHNEEKQLEGLIRNTRGVVDDMIVVAAQCTDGTVKVAERNGARIIYSDSRISEANHKKGIENARTEWILMMDPDERLSEELKKEMMAAKNAGDADVYLIKRINFMIDGFASDSSPINDYVTRFFKKGHIQLKGHQHEIPKYTGVVKRLNGRMLHYSMMSIPAVFEKTGFYNFETQDILEKQGREDEMPFVRNKKIVFLFGKHGWRKMFIFPIFWFFYYIIKQRIIFDGYRGVVIAAIASFGFFLQEAYYWERQSKKRKGISIDWEQEYPERQR